MSISAGRHSRSSYRGGNSVPAIGDRPMIVTTGVTLLFRDEDHAERVKDSNRTSPRERGAGSIGPGRAGHSARYGLLVTTSEPEKSHAAAKPGDTARLIYSRDDRRAEGHVQSDHARAAELRELGKRRFSTDSHLLQTESLLELRACIV